MSLSAGQAARRWGGKRDGSVQSGRGISHPSDSHTLARLLIDVLLVALVLCMFVPDGVAFDISLSSRSAVGGGGAINLTPAFAVSILLFPLLIYAGKIRWVWPDLLVVLMFSVHFVSMAMSSPLSRCIEAMGRIVLISAVPYLAGRYVIQDISRLGRILRLLVTAIALMALLAFFESVFRFNIHSHVWGVPYDPHKDIRLGLTRAHGWTSHAIMFGIVNAAFVPLVLVAYREKLPLFGRLPLIKMGILLLGCFFSLSTGAWGPALLSVLFVAWDYYAPFNRKWLWPWTFAILVGGYVVLELLSNRPLMRILMMNLHISNPTAWHYRWLLFERVYSVMPGHWNWGHGLSVPEEFAGSQFSIDNNFLVVLLRYGRIGLGLWIAVSISVLLYTGRAVWVGKPTRLVRLTRAMCFSLLGIILTQTSVALFSMPESLYWLMMGLILGATIRCRREQLINQARFMRSKQKSLMNAQGGEVHPRRRSHASI